MVVVVAAVVGAAVAAAGIKFCLNVSEQVAGRSGTEEARPPNQLRPVNEEDGHRSGSACLLDLYVPLQVL